MLVAEPSDALKPGSGVERLGGLGRERIMSTVMSLLNYWADTLCRSADSGQKFWLHHVDVAVKRISSVLAVDRADEITVYPRFGRVYAETPTSFCNGT